MSLARRLSLIHPGSETSSRFNSVNGVTRDGLLHAPTENSRPAFPLRSNLGWASAIRRNAPEELSFLDR